jgi:hypothetical protein
MFWRTVVLGFLFLGAAMTGRAQDRPPALDDILTRHAEASGLRADAAVRTITRSGTLLRGALGRVPFTATSRVPGCWIYDQVFAYGAAVRYGFDGARGWVCDGQGTAPLAPAERLDLQLLWDPQAPLRLREFFPEMKVSGVRGSGDSAAVAVQARSPEGVQTELLFGAKTGFLLKAGGLRFEDYRAEGPLTLPHRIFFDADGQLPLTMEINQTTMNDPAPDSLFVPPACPLAPRKAPLYTVRRQVTIDGAALNACVGVYQHPTEAKSQYTVSRQGDHLMIEKTGWGQRIEIKPESALDYFVRFRNWEFHFVRDDNGRITAMDIGGDRKLRAARVG